MGPRWAAARAAVGCCLCCVVGAAVLAAAAAAASTKYPEAADAAFYETFEPGWEQRWVYSAFKKYKGRFQAVQPEGFQDAAIQMPAANQHYGMAAPLREPLAPRQGLVVQYEVTFSQGHTCGGAYLKLLSQPQEASGAASAAGGGGGQQEQEQGGLALDRLRAKTPFSIMFGPDRCGPQSRVHVILRLHNPALNNVTEHHLLTAPAPKEDAMSHVYALVLAANGRYKVLIDGQEEASGSLLEAKFEPPLQPPEVIPDPEHVKPDDWVEEEMMDDPTAQPPEGWDDRRMVPDPAASKPEGWLESELPELPDPDAVKPDDWDEAALGVWLPPPVANPACEGAPGCGPWKAPLVKNPAYKGPWVPPQVKNPAYKGPWKQREVPNPAYFKLEGSALDLIPPVAAVAFELWTTDAGYTFDSVLLGSGDAGAKAAAGYMRHVWRHRHQAEVAAAMAKARAESRPPGLRAWASNMLLDLLERPELDGLRPRLGPLLRVLQHQPEAAWAALLVPGWLLVTLLVERLTRKKGDDTDLAEDDDDNDGVNDGTGQGDQAVDEEEVKRASRQAAELQKQRRAAAAAGDGGAAARPDERPEGDGEQQQQQQQQAEPQEAEQDSKPDSPPAVQTRRRGASRRA